MTANANADRAAAGIRYNLRSLLTSLEYAQSRLWNDRTRACGQTHIGVALRHAREALRLAGGGGAEKGERESGCVNGGGDRRVAPLRVVRT